MTASPSVQSPTGATTLSNATHRFLRRDGFEPTTCDVYGVTLSALAEVVGAEMDVAEEVDVAAVTTEQLEDELLEQWAAAAGADWGTR